MHSSEQTVDGAARSGIWTRAERENANASRVKQPDGTVKALTVKQVADLLGHSTTQVTEMYYVKKDTSMLNGITNDFCL